MRPKHQRLLFIVIGILCLGVGVGIVLSVFKENLVFFYSPSEIQAEKVGQKLIRVGGLVKKGSIVQEEKGLVTRFVITDMQKDLSIRYKGVLPALFREEQGMVAKGRLQSDGVFAAEELLAKHDENYMPPEVADALKKSGHWHAEKP